MKPMKRKDSHKIRVFLVDDFDVVQTGVKTIIEGAPEKDLAFVGNSKLFSADVPEQIARLGAEVVLIDIEDSREDPLGLQLIRRIRQQMGSSIGIIAYTAYKKYREVSVDCGADKFLLKGVTNDALRLGVRECKRHTFISMLELFLEDREIYIQVTSGDGVSQRERCGLGRDAFAMMYYLSEERAANDMEWLIKNNNVVKGSNYVFAQSNYWSEIRKRWVRSDQSEGVGQWDNMEISRHSSIINKAVRDALQNNALQLIIVPRGGRKTEHAYTNSYYLNPFIESKQIVFRGNRIPMVT